MLLSPQALRANWPQTPEAFNRFFVRGDFDPASSACEYTAMLYGTSTSSLQKVKIPSTADQAWTYFNERYMSLGIPNRTKWVEAHCLEFFFRINFAALAAAEYLQCDRATFLCWPRTFEDAVKLSRLRLRFTCERTALGVSFSHPARPAEIQYINVWDLYDFDHPGDKWALPQIFISGEKGS